MLMENGIAKDRGTVCRLICKKWNSTVVYRLGRVRLFDCCGYRKVSFKFANHISILIIYLYLNFLPSFFSDIFLLPG